MAKGGEAKTMERGTYGRMAEMTRLYRNEKLEKGKKRAEKSHRVSEPRGQRVHANMKPG